MITYKLVYYQQYWGRLTSPWWHIPAVAADLALIVWLGKCFT